jgi:hypothetical protein
MHKVAVNLYAFKLEKASAAKGGSRGSPPGKIKNLMKGVLSEYSIVLIRRIRRKLRLAVRIRYGELSIRTVR